MVSKNNLVAFYKSLQENQTPETEIENRVFLFLERKARIKGVPLVGHFELTPFCNLDCKMCYVHLNSQQFSASRLLSVEDWKSLIHQAHKLGMLRAALTGGECLTYPGFDDIYMYLIYLGIKPSILTNGLLLDQKRISFFTKNPPKRLQVTLYGSSDDAYERVTGHRVFDKIIHNVVLAKDSNLPVAISITPNGYMYADMQNLLQTVESLHIPYAINSRLKSPRKNTGRTQLDFSDEQYIELYKLQNKMRNIDLSEVDYVELPSTKQVEHRVVGLKCGGGRSAFAIKYDGSLSPCLSLPDVVAYPMKTSFADAWNQINIAANNYPIPSECISCRLREICLTCPALHLHSEALGHCDTRICAYTKKLVKAGIVPMPAYENERKA